MTNYIQLGGENVQVAASHLGGTTIAPNGTAVALSLPADTSCVYFRAESAAAYYQVGGGTATAASHGFVPSGGADMIFASDNLSGVSVFTGTGGTVHIQYYSG
jgi:hypothetical protein